MKKSILFLGMLLVFSHSLWAQLHSYIEDASDSLGISAGGSVVRNYNDEYAIGFFRTAGVSYFYAVNTASGITPFTQGNKLTINGIWDVKDIYFHNNEAFFCGSVGGNGIIGHFPVSNLINGSGSVSVETVMVTGKRLSRLVAYGSSSSYRVAAIDSTVIVLCDFATLKYHFRDFPLVDGELVYDVLMKEDSLLYVGTDTTYNCVTVRSSSCANPILLSAPWRYHPALAPSRVITTGSIATLLPYDRLAVVHQIANEQHNIEMDLLIIQLPDMQCIDRHAFVNQHRVHYHDLKYIPTTQRLTLLYTDFVQFDRYVLEWQPLLNNNYTANVLQPVLRYNSMDCIGNLHFFMVSGFQWILQNTLGVGWANSCETHWLATVTHKPAHYKDPGNYSLILTYNINFTPVSFNTSVSPFKVTIDCLHSSNQ